MPTTFALGANYPNPFNPATTIPLAVPDGAKNVDLTIYNVLGQPMRQVWTGPLPAGEHRLTWDGRDAQGRNPSPLGSMCIGCRWVSRRALARWSKSNRR